MQLLTFVTVSLDALPLCPLVRSLTYASAEIHYTSEPGVVRLPQRAMQRSVSEFLNLSEVSLIHASG